MGLNEMLGAWPSTGLLVQPGHRAATSGPEPYLDCQSSVPSTTPQEKAWGSWEEQEDGKGRDLMPTPLHNASHIVGAY